MNESGTPEISPELLAVNSMVIACGSADQGIDKVVPGISAAYRMAFLQEFIFFHHFMAIVAVFRVCGDVTSRSYCDRMLVEIHSGNRLPANEQLGLSDLTHFSVKDREDAIKACFFSPGNISVCMRQELYLGRKPSDAELDVMNLETVKTMTSWDSPSANEVQYFTAALLARLTISLQIEPRQSFLNFINLSLFVAAGSKATFKLYVELLGAEFLIQSDDHGPERTPEAKRNWLSRLFK